MQPFGFGGEFVGRGGRFLDPGRILLRGAVHLADRGVDLLQRARLFAGARREIGHRRVDLGDLGDDQGQRFAGRPDPVDALRDLLARRRNQRLDLLGGLGRALRQRAHFRGDDGEAAPRIARPRRLDAGVQGEQIGLESELVDDADDLADLLRGFFDPAHRLDRFAHHLAALFRAVLGRRDHLARVTRLFRRPFDGGRDLVERRRRALEVRRLLFGALRQIERGRGDRFRAQANGLGIGVDRHHGLVERIERGVEIIAQLLGLGRERLGDAEDEIALGQMPQRAAQSVYGELILLRLLGLFGLAGEALALGLARRPAAACDSRPSFSIAASLKTWMARAIMPISSPRPAP